MAGLNRLFKAIQNIQKSAPEPPLVIEEPIEETPQPEVPYWTGHNVSQHRVFASCAESLSYLDWRNDQYFNYLNLMPVAGFDGLTVLDFGCGPGHDLVGIGTKSKPARLIGMDISPTSLEQAHNRLALHEIQAEFIQLSPDVALIPLPDATVDHIHSSGVLHHTPDPLALLKEFRRVIKPTGTSNIMVYNYDSIWLHLYVAYVTQLRNGQYSDEEIRSAFRHTTDGPDCPISNVYRAEEWIELCNQAGFNAEFSGAAVSLWECSLLSQYRFDACMDRKLPAESREFLMKLVFDMNGYPIIDGQYAGIDGCYRLVPA